MRTFRAVVLSVALLTLSACGGSASAGTPTAPTAPPPSLIATRDAAPAPRATALAPAPTIARVPAAPPGPLSPSVTAPAPPVAGIVIPGVDAEVTVPVHVLARLGAPDQPLTATLRWRDGTTLKRDALVLRGEDGRGLLVASLDWGPIPQPPNPPTQPATLELRDLAGTLLARRMVTVLAAADPAVQTIRLYWVAGDPADPAVLPVPAAMLRTPYPEAAALEALLWGPPQPTQIGYTTALPDPREVLAYPGREPDWGPRVTLRGLAIRDGLATADFSRELGAYGGGSRRAGLIRQQVSRTLEQFPTVRAVRIVIEGQTEDALGPSLRAGATGLAGRMGRTLPAR